MRETDFTNAVAEIATRDDGFRLRLMRALLSAAARHETGAGRRAARLRRHAPRKEVRFHNQQHSENILSFWQSVIEMFGRPKNLWNFVDWVWETDTFLLAVEVKLNSRTVYQPEQLRRYAAMAKLSGRLFYGALVLTPTAPPRDAIRRVHRQHGFVGAVLWKDAAAQLQAISPANPDDQRRWSALIEQAAGTSDPTSHACQAN